jgi:hypothetical protein
MLKFKGLQGILLPKKAKVNICHFAENVDADSLHTVKSAQNAKLQPLVH